MEKNYNNYTDNKATTQDGKDDNDRDESESPITLTAAIMANNQEDVEKEMAKEREDDNEINVVVDDDAANLSTINNNVNKPTADDEEIHNLLAEVPASSSTKQKTIQNAGANEMEEDEESSLMETSFERPYTATLAPLDMELIERLNRERESKRRSSSAGKRRDNRSSWARKSVDSTKIATTMIMERERLNSDAGRRAQQLNEFQTIVGDRTPADHDSQKPPLMSMTNANTAESISTQTLLSIENKLNFVFNKRPDGSPIEEFTFLVLPKSARQ